MAEGRIEIDTGIGDLLREIRDRVAIEIAANATALQGTKGASHGSSLMRLTSCWLKVSAACPAKSEAG
jgi:hypothetical protein